MSKITVCGLETSTMRCPVPNLGCCPQIKKCKLWCTTWIYLKWQ